MGDNEKPRKAKKAPIDTEAIPAHILNIMENAEKKAKKHKKEHEANKRAAKDSVSLIRNMMGSVRTKNSLSSVDDEMRRAKEKDIAMIASAKDIFKEMEVRNCQEEVPQLEKHKMRVKDVDWIAEMPSKRKDEELKRKREREMELMRSARHMTQEQEDEAWQIESARRENELKRAREIEIERMRMARAQAQEEEDMIEDALRQSGGRREPSPGLEAARGALRRRQEEEVMEERRSGRKEPSPGLEAARSGMRREMFDDGPDKVEEMKLARAREIEEMRMARASIEEDQRQEKRERDEERSRELQELRMARSQQSVKARYNPDQQDHQGTGNKRSNAFEKAPRSKVRSDQWMKKAGDSRAEELRVERERELEEMKMLRAQAIEEEEQERAEMEAIKREEAMHKAREMAMLVAELQRMRQEDHQEEEEKLTSYQEEMLNRVMELAALARGGILTQ